MIDCVNCGHEIEWQGVNLVHKNQEYTQCIVDKCGCNDPSETCVTSLIVTNRKCTKENPCCLHDISPNEDWEECCKYCMKRSELNG